MSRSGYSEDLDHWTMIRYRGQVASAIRGSRGQEFLRDLVDSLDALPEKKLIANHLDCGDGVCAIGSVGRKRGIDLNQLDPENIERVASIFDIAEQLAREIVYENDEAVWGDEDPSKRWLRMRNWAQGRIIKEPAKAIEARQGGGADAVHESAVACDLPEEI